MKCLLCGIEEHDAWNSLMIPTVQKGFHLSFILCGSCVPLGEDDVLARIPPGKYDTNLQMQVLDV